MAAVYIGLGTNLGDRHRNLQIAKKELARTETITILHESSIEETEPVDYLDQPMFLNQVILAETELQPLRLLAILKKIEGKLGRERTIAKGPRTIDLDILLYDDMVIHSEELTIPHAEIKNRAFVLKHLAEISPALADPETGEMYKNFLRD